jgi:hypothetical protein
MGVAHAFSFVLQTIAHRVGSRVSLPSRKALKLDSIGFKVHMNFQKMFCSLLNFIKK